MSSEFGGGFGKGDGDWNSFGAGQQSWNEFGEENSGPAAVFGNLKPAGGKRDLKVVLIILALFIAAGVTAAVLRVTGHRSREKAETNVISQTAQDGKEPDQARENEEFPGSEEQDGSDGRAQKDNRSQSSNLPAEKKEEPEETPSKDYSYAHGYYYAFLTEQEAKAYDALVEACENLSEKADISLESEVEEVNVLDAFAYDHPEYYWVFYEPSYTFDQTGHIFEFKMDIPDDAEDILDRMSREADSVVRTVRNIENTYDRYKWIYSYIIDNTEYGTADGVDDQSVTGGLLNHLAVCHGYASTFKYLCDQCGLDCITVKGDALNIDGSVREAHAWNMIFIGEVPYWVDVTWGDPQFSSEIYWYDDWKDYSYLCVEEDTFMKKHRIDSSLGREEEYPDHFHAAYPRCTDTRYDYFRLMGLYFDSVEDAEGYIRKNLSEGVPYLWMRFHTKEEQERAIRDLQEGRIWDLVVEEEAPFSQSQYFYDDVFYTLIVEFR